jgi:tRNA(fMet)-specific endonuclease VapC
MAVFVLDTSTLTLLQHGHPRATAHLQARAGHTLAVTSTVIEEALGGWYAALRQARTNAEQAQAAAMLADAFNFLAKFPVYPLTEPALDRVDRLTKLKLNVGRMDLKIAALALELGATVVTHNVRDFGRVPGLLIEDWSV